MTEDERELLRGELLKAERYLEYGSGASTRVAAQCPNLKTICSVESDPAFVRETLLQDDGITAAQNRGSLQFRFVDIGPTRKWGFPQSRAKRHLWPNYALAGFVQPTEWDLILIDGRFRVACVLLAALELPNAKVLVHDFCGRGEYRTMLRFMRIARQTDTLVRLERRHDFNLQAAQRALGAYLYAPDDRVGMSRVRYILNVLWLRVTGRDSTRVLKSGESITADSR